MPTSFFLFKDEIQQWFLKNVPTSKRILDVGPGVGTYSHLLYSLGYRMDAVEIYEPYVEKYNLRKLYDNVYVDDIMKFDYSDYDFIILGDVLEHLERTDAIKLILTINMKNKQCLVAVPYLMEQGESEDNIHETHLQADLTPTVMSLAYSELELLYDSEYYGYYIMKDLRHEKAFVLYATESYAETVQECVTSIRKFSDLPIYVYMLNSDIEIFNAITINWICKDVDNPVQEAFIDRSKSSMYRLLIQRPLVVMDALEKYAKTVAYIDADSIATSYVETIFDMYPAKISFPYFVTGIYDFLFINGRGSTKLEDTLEAPGCKLFNVDQSVRTCYRQTGYFVAGEFCMDFLNEWYWMCIHPEVMKNPQLYAPYHEETILNILLWKHNITEGLPYIYINGGINTLNDISRLEFKENYNGGWTKVPEVEEHLLFYHGEKDPKKMNEMIEKLENKPLRILYLAPHLSTGGMPQFLLKRIEALKKFTKIVITVVEYENYSADFVVQKNKIMSIVDKFYTLGENKLELLRIILDNKIDIVHIDEMSERLDREMIKQLYSNDRTYRIIETCHDISFDPSTKIFHPDVYAFCTPHHLESFSKESSVKTVIEYPIDNNTPFYVDKNKARQTLGLNTKRPQVLNVGLWTKGKNQGEGIEIAKKYPHMDFNFVGNMAGNFKEYWEPLVKNLPSNVKIWGERDIIDVFMKACHIFMFNSTWECNPIVLREAISYHLPIIARNLPQYCGMFDNYIYPIDTDLNNLKAAYEIPTNNTLDIFANKHLNMYKAVTNIKVEKQTPPISEISITQHFVENPFLEILGESDSDFDVRFFDDKGVLQFSQIIKSNHWIKLNRKYFTAWTAQVFQDNVLIYENVLDLTNKSVLISFDSSSLGDTIAWIPYCLEFQKKHNCRVAVSTFKNSLFKMVYPELTFVEPGTVVPNLYAMYRIGWFYNKDSEPVLPNTIPLQQTITNILGLEYTEIVPRIWFVPKLRTCKGKYVTIATNSTSGCKFWVKEEWQKLVNHLHDQGYKIINVSSEVNKLDNVAKLSDTSLENTMNTIYYSDFFIGLSSGLSWLAWAMKKPILMISNFTEEDHEFKCIRITNKSVCHGCWNNPNFKFDKGDWNWCPINKGTSRQFECQKSITAEMVIKKTHI